MGSEGDAKAAIAVVVGKNIEEPALKVNEEMPHAPGSPGGGDSRGRGYGSRRYHS